jgi:hypothetical protein
MSATAIYASRILTPQEELRDCVIVVEAIATKCIFRRAQKTTWHPA